MVFLGSSSDIVVARGRAGSFFPAPCSALLFASLIRSRIAAFRAVAAAVILTPVTPCPSFCCIFCVLALDLAFLAPCAKDVLLGGALLVVDGSLVVAAGAAGAGAVDAAAVPKSLLTATELTDTGMLPLANLDLGAAFGAATSTACCALGAVALFAAPTGFEAPTRTDFA